MDSTEELREVLKREFADAETRAVYARDYLNGRIATQIKVLREQRGLTQDELAARAGMKQSRISELEDVNYSMWSLSTLRRLAEAFGLSLLVDFVDTDTLISDITSFDRGHLERPQPAEASEADERQG